MRGTNTFFRNMIRNKQLLLMAAPGFLFFLVYYYLPMGGVIIAFQDFKPQRGIWNSEFIGWTNFKFFFQSDYASRVIVNTLYLNVLFIATVLVVGLGVALVLNEVSRRFIAKVAQSAMFLPYFLSWVVVGYFSLTLFNDSFGVLNRWLESIGVGAISWYSEPKYWPFILVILNLWKSLGVSVIIYYAAIISVDKSLIEAALVDGASRWRTTRSIVIPSITPIITIMVLLQIGQIFRADFGLFYNVTRDVGALYATTDVIDTFVVRSLRVLGDIGMSSAASLFQSVAGLITVVISNYVVRRINSDNALY